MEDELKVGPVIAAVLVAGGSIEGASTGCKVSDPPEELGELLELLMLEFCESDIAASGILGC